MSQIVGRGPARNARIHRARVLTWVGLVTCWLLLGGFGLRASVVRAQDEYPAPFVPEINPIEDGSNLTDTTEVYPAPVPNIIGSDAQPSQLDFPPAVVGAETATAPDVAGESSSGLLFLWGGFTAALLIFATAVVGSVVLFARRTEQ